MVTWARSGGRTTQSPARARTSQARRLRGPSGLSSEVLDEEAGLAVQDLDDLGIADGRARGTDVDVAQRLGGLPADGSTGHGGQLVAERQVREVRVRGCADAVEHAVLDASAAATDPSSQHVAHVGEPSHEVLLRDDVGTGDDAPGLQRERQAGVVSQVSVERDRRGDVNVRDWHDVASIAPTTIGAVRSHVEPLRETTPEGVGGR